MFFKIIEVDERLRIFNHKFLFLLIINVFNGDTKFSTLKDEIGKIIEHTSKECVEVLIL